MAATGQLHKHHWRLYPQQKKIMEQLAWGLDIPGPVAQVLMNRGINTVEDGKRFLNPCLSRLYSPFSMKDMDRAVLRIQQALNKGERIAVYGDYDVDGVTATALLYDFLKGLQGDVVSYIPHRLHEGYGLNLPALKGLQEQGVSLVITVDCGISSREEIAGAKAWMVDVIVTDHHHPPACLPDAAAVVNPLRPDCVYPFKQLSGAGIAFKLIQGLGEQAGADAGIWDYLDLVALGTIADVCPLVEENRILVTYGLETMERTLRPGIQALCQAAGLSRPTLNTDDVAYLLSPRLNAAGRLGDADIALNLLLMKNLEEARPVAMHLHQENSRRQKLEADILAEAHTLAEYSFGEDPERKFLLLAREGWHQGVLGIVASRMAEKYRLPVMLLALQEGLGRGSGRSAGGFSLIEALENCQDLLSGFGGHDAAAGVTVEAGAIPALAACLERQARLYFAGQEPQPDLLLDALIEPEDLNPVLVQCLDMLEPFGYGNPRPFFLGTNWSLEHKKEVGKGKKHLQLQVKKNGKLFRGICFNGKTRLEEADLLREMDLVFSVSFDRWRGSDALQLEIHQSAYRDEFPGKPFTLVDRRGVKAKKRYLESLLEKNEAVLVVVNTHKRLKQLQDQFGGRANIAFSHQGEVPAQRALGDPAHLVFYDLPLGENKLLRLVDHLVRLAAGTETTRIHLLYHEQDYQDNLKLFAATLPSLASIEQVFHLLQEITAGQPTSWPGLTRHLSQRLPFAHTSHLLESCLSLLKQADYITPDHDGLYRLQPQETADYCLLLKDVAGTEDFLQVKKQWQQSIAWQRHLLEAPGEEIAARLAGSSPGR